LASLSLLLTGCASEPRINPSGPPPEIRLASVIELLSFKTSNDKVDVILDKSGNAHVLIAAETLKEVHHVAVSPEGIVQRELVEHDSSPSTISAAIDSEARLHLLLDDKHLVREASSWSDTYPAPWESIGMKVHSPRFVRSKDGLIWVFTVFGEEIGVPGRWEWFGFGGYGAAIIFPWHLRSEKLMIVPEAALAEPRWYVVDREDNLDATNILTTVDDNRNLHVLYDASYTSVNVARTRQLHITLLPPSAPGGQSEPINHSKQLDAYSGRETTCFFSLQHRGLSGAAAAADPVSGTVLVVKPNDSSIAFENGRWSTPLRLPLSIFWTPKLAPAGGNAFHLITQTEPGVAYLYYAHGSWSAPVELGQAGVASVWGSTWGALNIASDGRNHAFVVWPTETGIVGRWVEGTAADQVSSFDAALAQPAGTTPLPEHLLDFARGKAQLAGGFAAASAAGEHGWITKCLYDEGQLEKLASVVLEDRYGDNLRWYYLGWAAEKMGLCDAAEYYYQVSKEQSENFSTRCLGSASCHGFRLPEILGERFLAVQAMRSAGKCSPAP